MDFNYTKICKVLAVVIFVAAFLGSFTAANSLSEKTVLVKEYEYLDNDYKTVKDDAIYFSVLISSWIGAGVLSLVVYGIGEIVEITQTTNNNIVAIGKALVKNTAVSDEEETE